MIGILIGEGLVFALIAGLLALYAWMFGRIAGRLGRNPVLFGCLFLIPFVQLIPMAVLAFGEQRTAIVAE